MSDLVSFDVAHALERAQAVTDDGVLSFCELTVEDYHVYYVDDRLAAKYEDLDADIERTADALYEFES